MAKPTDLPLRLAVAGWLEAYHTLLRTRQVEGEDRPALLRAYFAARKALAAVLLDCPHQSFADATGVYSLAVGEDGRPPYPIWQPPLAAKARAAG